MGGYPNQDAGERFRLCLPILPDSPGLPFVRYPISVIPADETIAFVTDGIWQGPAVYRDGVWRKNVGGDLITRALTHWTVLDREASDA